MQFDVYRSPRGRRGYVVDVQADLLSDIRSRVVIPLIAKSDAPAIVFANLNPTFLIAGVEHVLLTQALASVPVAELGIPAASLMEMREEIIRAMDVLMSGI